MKSYYVPPKCAACADSGWVYPSDHAFANNRVIRCPKCYPTDEMRRADQAPDRTGERP